METWIVFGAFVVVGLAFMMWLGMFILSRGINLNLETDAESRRIALRQLVFGGILLAALVGLGVYYSQMDREEILPEIGPGLTTSAPKVREVLEKKSGAATGETAGAKPSAETASGE